MRILRALLALIAITAPILSADVTLRFKSDIVSGPGIPRLDASPLPPTTVTYLKGNNGFTQAGKLSFYMDFGKQEVTLVNSTEKQFTTVPMKDYASAMVNSVPAVPEVAAKMMDSMKVDVATRKTGRTDTIAGVEVEETEIIVNSTMDIPGLKSNGQPFSKMVMQLWNAKKEEAFRVPALREFMNYTLYAEFFTGATGSVQKMLAASPGVGKALGPMLEEVKKNQTVALRTHVSVFVPMLAMMPRAAGAPASDPNAPVAEITTEATEFSNGPVDDSVFRVPQGFAPVPMEEMMKSIMPAPKPAKQ